MDFKVGMGKAEEEGKAVFGALRPLCVEVMSRPSVETLAALESGLQRLPEATFVPPQLLPYLSLPVRAAIKRAGSSDPRLLESALLAMAALLFRVRELDTWQLFHEVFSLLCMLLDDKMASEAGFSEPSEELVGACLKTMKHLLLCSTSKLHDQLYTQLVPLGHCVSVLLHIASHSGSNDLQRGSLMALCALAGLDVTPILVAAKLHSGPTDLETAVGDYLDLMRECVGVMGRGRGATMASFLPGVCSAVTRLLTSDANTVESVLSLGVITWAHYVGVGVAKGEVPREEESWTESRSRAESRKQGADSTDPSKSLAVERTGEWLEGVAKHLSVLVQRMCVLVTSDVWKVRVQLVGWAHSLLQHCSQSLEPCALHWLEVLVTLAHDPYPAVSTAARAALAQFPGSGHGLTSLLGQQLHSLVSSLPRLIRQHDDNRKVATLQLLAGYMGLAGGHVTLMVHSLPHLSRLVQALVQTLTLKTDAPRVTTLSLPSLTPSALSPKLPPLTFAHFNSDRVSDLMGEVCRLLGCRGDLVVVVDYILDECHAHPDLGCEYLLLLSQVLAGGGHKGCGHQEAPPTSVPQGEMFAMLEGVFTRLVEAETSSCDLPNSNSSLNSDLFTFLFINIIHTCVHVLGKNFDPLLQQLLYPLMQRLGDDNVGVVDAAMATLKAVCLQCGYDSVAYLIGCNADYLAHAISVHLRHASRGVRGHHGAVRVLGAVVQHGEEGVCAMVRDCIDDLLTSLDTRQADPTVVWAGLRTLAKSCECFVSSRCANDGESKSGGVVRGEEGSGVVEEEEERNGPVGIEAIAEFFLQHHKAKEGVGQEEEPEGEGDMVEEPYSQEERTLPAVEQVCVEVMRRCGHHMSHDQPDVRLVVMDTLQHCLRTLSHNKLMLYPEAHLVWAPLLPRLTDPAHPVARRAWQVVLCMCEVCGDFLRKRVLEKVYPLLVSSLEKLGVVSAKAEPLYQHSAKFKLQCSLLECACGVCKTLSLPSRHVELVAIAMVRYLSSDQPRPLQELCLQCFKVLISLDPDLVWLVLQQMVPPTLTTPTDSTLKPFKFPPNPDSAKYVANVELLLSKTFNTH